LITGVDKNEVFEYVSKLDKGDKPTIWKLGVLLKKDSIAMMTDAVTASGEMDIKALQANSPKIVKAGLRGVKNYQISKGVDPKDYDEVTEELLESIPTLLIPELASQIIANNFVTDDETKN